MERYELSETLTLIRSGIPVITTALELPPLGSSSLFHGQQGGFSLTVKKGLYCLEWVLDPMEVLNGLGQALGPVNRRGKIFESWCIDDFSHTPEKKSLYGAHNFLISWTRETANGLFIDLPGHVTWDLGFTDPNHCRVTWTEAEFDVVFIKNKTPLEVSRQFIALSGRPYPVPRWAFGYFQSRWAYPTQDSVREVAQGFKENDMPLEGINLDIDYMDRMRVFTVNQERFPDLGALARELAPIKLIPILDPGIAVEKDFDLAQEGLEAGYFAGRVGQEAPFIGAVWPGNSYFPDFRRDVVRNWWALKVQELCSQGIEGYWVDMNEPAIFYSPEGLEALFKVVDETRTKENLQVEDFFRLKDQTAGLSNSRNDYKAMTQEDPVKGVVSHERIHNLYGKDMLEATAQGMTKAHPGKRTLVYTRSSFQGAQRSGGMWTGDNASWWEHILLHIRTVTSLHLQGFLYSGSDVGGFTSDASAQLIIRWSQVGVMTPLFRNHSCGGTRFQEPYQFDPESRVILKKVLDLRYALLPWLYSAFMICRWEQGPFWQPLGYHYPGSQAQGVEDQILLGRKVMFTPVIQNNHTGRTVFLPEHPWLCIRFTAWDDYSLKVYQKGTHWVDIGLEETCVFLAPGGTLLLARPGKNSHETTTQELEILGFGKQLAKGVLWEDDGQSFDFEKGVMCLTELTLERKKKELRVKMKSQGEYSSGIHTVRATFVTPRGRVFTVNDSVQ